MKRLITIVSAMLGAILLAMPAAMAFQDHAGTFGDDDGNVHEADIEAIFDADVTDGCNPPANDAYCPSEFVTRGQMAKFLDRAKGLPASDQDAFVDDDDSIFEPHINDLAAADVTDGCNPPENDEYCPERNVTRDEMASFLARALQITHDDPTPFGNETCDPAYFPCVPTVDEMGDLDCGDINEHYPDGVQIDEEGFGDPHDLNADGDDMACEPAG